MLTSKTNKSKTNKPNKPNQEYTWWQNIYYGSSILFFTISFVVLILWIAYDKFFGDPVDNKENIICSCTLLTISHLYYLNKSPLKDLRTTSLYWLLAICILNLDSYTGIPILITLIIIEYSTRKSDNNLNKNELESDSDLDS
ncbi:MAG: hypothetical protein ULS35scaffold63_30 [Phage 33_17]|nr:MAG: hypothetical protein ULS35scaffold63_30 [Phage 33_17]